MEEGGGSRDEGGSSDEGEVREEWRVKKGGEREGGRDGGREEGREGGMDGGAEGRRGGGTERQSRLCPVILYGMNSIHILNLYPLVRPTLEYASAVCDLYTTTQTVSLIISKTNRTVTHHIITCKQ